MENIKLFLGSSITELKEERHMISALIQAVNDALIDAEIYSIIDLFLCEHQSAAINMQGSQSAINQELIQSDIAIFLVASKFGEYTKEEFDVAYMNKVSFGNPEIIVLFKEDQNDNTKSNQAMYFLEHVKNIPVIADKYHSITNLMELILKSLNEMDNRFAYKKDGDKHTIQGKKIYI